MAANRRDRFERGRDPVLSDLSGGAHPTTHKLYWSDAMMKKELLEAERIAGELLKVDRDFRRTGQERLNVDGVEGLTLAKAVQIFQGTLEAKPLSSAARMQRDLEASL
jgi:hypothetical protein